MQMTLLIAQIYSGHVHVCIECRGFESHPRQLIFLRKSDCLGCAVLLCLTLLASFFLLISHLNMYVHIHMVSVAYHKLYNIILTTSVYSYHICIFTKAREHPAKIGNSLSFFLTGFTAQSCIVDLLLF